MDKDVNTLIDKLLANYAYKQENLLQILIEIQHTTNHIPKSIVQYLSDKLDISLAKINGVIGFYGFLYPKPAGKYIFLFSDNIIEQYCGNQKLAQQLAKSLKIKIDKTKPEDIASISFTSCIGMSDQGPAALINGQVLTNLTLSRIKKIAKLVNSGQTLANWPRKYFKVKGNLQHKNSMLGDWYHAGAAIKVAYTSGSENMLELLDKSNLRGRGGAGFKTADKWRVAYEVESTQKVIVCNADEGEPGTFKDRLLLQKYADRLFEGMTVCAAIVGASKGFVYLRGEYRYLLKSLKDELKQRQESNLLGKSILGNSGFDFDIKIHLGAGAYICGEETALLESLEGKRGNPRIRPPYPATDGYLGHPTVVNNVETFVAAASIVECGLKWYKSQGTAKSFGTKLISISGDCKLPGVYEVPFGISVQKILDLCEATNTMAVQVSGPAGTLISEKEFNRKLSYEDLAAGGSFMIFNNKRNVLDIVYNFTSFFCHESCGFCTPCRVGTTLLKKRLEKIVVGHATLADLEMIKSIADTMVKMSNCGLGTTASNPLLQSMEKFLTVYENKLCKTTFEPAFDLDGALEKARAITNRNDPDAHVKGGGV